MDFLTGLNSQQQQAVMAGLGPVLVLAGPGSGKTRVLTQRIAYLIASMGVRPYQILAVTFTNKAAREMESRVINLLGEQARGLTLGTFHAVCARILRREAEALPFEANFVIFDSDDQISLVKTAILDLNIDEKKFRAASVHASISRAKNEMVTPDHYPVQTYRDEVVKRVFQRYQELLLANNALDFDDLLIWTVLLFEQAPSIREKYARRFEHVLVDEFQDTNMVQYTLLKHLASFHHNIFVVGDTDQCFPVGTVVKTPSGSCTIETLEPGQLVLAASGRGHSMPAEIAHVGSRPYEGEVVRVTTRSGYTFRATPNHILFARLGVNPDVHYVYLMYRHDLGYRIGLVVGARLDGYSEGLQTGLRVRVNQEHGDRIWILRACNQREEAYYWEAYYAFQYGIPTQVFHVVGRNMKITQADINRLFSNIDTVERAEKLMADLGLDRRYPHYVPRSKLLRNSVNIRFFGDARRSSQSPWNAHRVDIWSSDIALREKLEAHGIYPRPGKRDSWRVGFSRLHFDEAQKLADELSQIGDGLEMVSGAFLTAAEGPQAARFSLMPAGQLHPTMIIAIERDGKILPDEVVEVVREPYQGKVYDLEVTGLHNYIAGGVVVHNSIYRWRGADYRNILRFEKDYPETQTILLEQNYRSTQHILDTAMAVIDRNPHRTHKQLFTDRGDGINVVLHEAFDERVESAYVVETIARLVAAEEIKPGDVAVMYRTNAQSRLLEEAFLHANLAYKLVGAQRFYGRREIKDIIAYLRLINNPNDEVSLGRVINTPPRTIGEKTLNSVRVVAQKNKRSIGLFLLEMVQSENHEFKNALPGRAAGPLTNFGNLLAAWRGQRSQLRPLELMDRVLEDIHYREYIDDGTDEGAERWENVMELRRLAAEYREQGLDMFLERVALVSDQDTMDEAASVPTLLTLHAAKGLEFPAVFIVGLDDGTLPHMRSFEDQEEMMEERRLLYVGITRAKDRLFLVHPLNRSAYGFAEPVDVSRFLKDIPDHLLKIESIEGVRRRGSANNYRPDLWEASSAIKTSKAVEQRYQPGMRVMHPVWGEGMVLSSRVQDDDEIVDIFFENVGLKRVAASLARLEIINKG